MNRSERHDNYRKQRKSDKFTGPQTRRAKHKFNRETARLTRLRAAELKEEKEPNE